MKFSQKAFATWLNVSLNTIQAWEQGTRRPNQFSLRLLEIFFIFTLLAGESHTFAGWLDRKAEGWAWYEETKIENSSKELTTSQQSPIEEIAQARKALEEKLSKALLNPTETNVLDYMKMQKKWIEQSAQFSKIWSKVLLQQPHLDNIATGFPVTQYGIQIQKQIIQEKREYLVKTLAKEYGLLFFYEGSSIASQEFSEIIVDFAKKYSWELFGISVDGVYLNNIKDNKQDNGIIEKLRVRFFPSLYCVNPNTQEIIPVSFGLISMDQIEHNFELQFSQEDQIRIILILLILAPSLEVFAGLNEDLNKFFGSFGSAGNVSSGDVYKGQAAGYMTGGGVCIRNRVMNSKIVTANLPRFDAGCGGIDIYSGGFSFIDHDQLIQNLKSIGSNAVGYAFLLGLETVSPQVANTIKQLQSWANTINALSINSCEAASTLTGAVWPVKTMGSQHICRNFAGKKGAFADYISARHKCSQSTEHTQIMESLNSNDIYKDILKDEYNLAWEAIQKQMLLMGNNDLAEFFMSLMGTVIIRKDDNNTVIETWPSKIDNESFLKTLIEGGNAEIYTCKSDSNNRCLFLNLNNIEIKKEYAWLGKIQDMLLEMQNNIMNDVPLSNDQKELLIKSRLPLYKIINVLTAYKKGLCPVSLLQVADIVAMDLLIQYLREAVQIVREGAHQLKRAQMYAVEIDTYLEELGRIEETIRYYETRTSQLMEREFHTMQKVQMLEEQIASEIIIN